MTPSPWSHLQLFVKTCWGHDIECLRTTYLDLMVTVSIPGSTEWDVWSGGVSGDDCWGDREDRLHTNTQCPGPRVLGAHAQDTRDNVTCSGARETRETETENYMIGAFGVYLDHSVSFFRKK